MIYNWQAFSALPGTHILLHKNLAKRLARVRQLNGRDHVGIVELMSTQKNLLKENFITR